MNPGARRDVLESLFALERLGMKFGLANMARLCDALGHPERAFLSVLVAGTNGKGSVTAMTESVLRAAGHRTARYTSPHLMRVEERFLIAGREVDTPDLEDAAAHVLAAADALVSSGALEGPPTFFEATTAIAFELFRRAAVELAVLEVGLGGRLDATNVVAPIATAIVSIDFDHQAQLGTTLASIAAEKAGIIRPGVPVVCGPLPAEAREVVARIAEERSARVVDAASSASMDRARALPLPLPGEHQVANAAVALALLDALAVQGIGADGRAIDAGIAATRWPARLERFDAGATPVLLDAAHNPAGARALAAYVRARWPAGVTLVFGAMRDKDVAGMLAPLASIAAETIATTAPTPRALEAEEVAALAARAGHARASTAPDPFDALKTALLRGRPVVVAGSIFLVGPVRERLARDILR